MLPGSDNPILFFDGVCNLCNGFVQFVIRNDKQSRFSFASLQSTAGNKVVQAYEQQQGKVPDSLILLYKGEFYTKSDAALMTARLLGGAWCFFLVGYIFPRFIRNAIYDKVAKNRYKWFGRKDECMIPTPELKSRFLE